MSLENLALGRTDNLPIRHEGDIHTGKVRSVYWLTPADCTKLIVRGHYQGINPGAKLGVMVISDRISAFDANWQGEDSLTGVPGKGAALNQISNYWFNRIAEIKIAQHHVLETPHPLVWIVQRASPVMVEAVARQYITGSMWRAYEKGERIFCGVALPDGLEKNQRLDKLLLTPTTKGVITGCPDVPEEDDVPLTREQILKNYQRFGLRKVGDYSTCENIVRSSFGLAGKELGKKGQLLVDTKFELGYIITRTFNYVIVLIDEALTPDSSRNWDSAKYAKGEVVENSKEGFRQFLLGVHGDILVNGAIGERKGVAASYKVPVEQMMGGFKSLQRHG